MIVYAHYEPSQDHAITLKQEVSASLTVGALTTNIQTLLVSKGLISSSANVTLKDCNGHALKPATEPVSTIVGQGEEIYITISDSKKSTPASAVAPAPTAAAGPAKADTSKTAPHAPEVKVDPSEVLEVKKQLDELMSTKKFKRARSLCETLLRNPAILDDNVKVMLYFTLCRVHLACERYEQAVDNAESAIKIAKKMRNESALAIAQLLFVAAQCHHGAGNFDEAESLSDDALTTLGGTQAALRPQNGDLGFEIIAMKAECMFEQGKHMQAASLVNGIITTAAGESKVPLLLSYAYFGIRYDKFEDALRALLKAIVSDQSNSRTRKLLSDVLKSQEGLQQVFTQIPPSASAASAYGFLATIAKDHSGIQACSDLLAAALHLQPQNISYALNLVHNHELNMDYDKALDAARRFLNSNPNLRVGAQGFDCNSLAQAMDNVDRECRNGVYNGDLIIDWVKVSDNDGYCRVRLRNIENFEDSFSKTEKLSDSSLDLLALAMTIVKIYYLQGKLHALPALFQIIEETKRISEVKMHETSIRNEAAYYHCIAQIMAVRPTLTPFCNAEDPISAAYSSPMTAPQYSEHKKCPYYIVGDSHTLSLSWAIMDINGVPAMTVPKLVTGIKHWHLRPQSDFYTKAGFNAAIQSIPAESKVIYVIGEIDCREGILVALERDRYTDLADGMSKTIEIFSNTILSKASVVTKKKLKNLIHPVIPALKATKAVVSQYNGIFRTKIANVKTNAWWLDLFADMSSSEGELKEELELDGTHIHPRHTQNVERELRKLVL